MNVRRGDVLLARYPFAAGVGVKRRPVLVVQNDQDNQRLTNTIVVQITSNLRRTQQPTHLLVEMKTPEGKQSGLLVDSVISCVNILTIDGGRIDRVIGSLPLSLMAKVDRCLKAALALP